MAIPIVLSEHDIVRFWSKVRKADGDGCWEWIGPRVKGYGYVTFGRRSRRLYAHRVTYTLAHGAIPQWADVLHLCGNRACCRVDHLCIGTDALNAVHRHIHTKLGPRTRPPERTPSEAFRLENRFWAKVDQSGDCWLWTGTRLNKLGYGGVRLNGKLMLAHRLAYMLSHGPIPDGLCVLHSCGTAACCRPEHLRVGTKRENAADMMGMGRRFQPDNRGERHGMAKLTEVQVIEIRQVYDSGTANMTQLATRYSVSRKAISLIVKRVNWKHLS